MTTLRELIIIKKVLMILMIKIIYDLKKNSNQFSTIDISVYENTILFNVNTLAFQKIARNKRLIFNA